MMDNPVTLSLRPARPEDAPACAAILQNWLDATDWVPDLHNLAGTTDFLRDVLIAQKHTTLAIENGAIAGFLTLDGEFVPALYVAARHRRAGIGSALLARAKSAAPRLNLWTFVANAGARRFYARHGFHEIRRTDGDNEENLPDILLEWRAT